MSDTIDDVVSAGAEDVRIQLGAYFQSDDPDAFTTIGTFGDGGAVQGTASADRVFTFVRWKWVGRHLESIPSRIDPYDDEEDRKLVARPTGNLVEVQGLTVIEERSGGEKYARWFVDWLSVYAQLGIVSPGRPVGLAQTEIRDFTEGRDPLPTD